ncbi:MAG: sigma-54-dependent transcriptional regulator [Sandaracinaceae bacterium]
MTDVDSVLIVDDDRSVGTVLIGLLRQAGYDASHVLAATDGIARVLSRPVDVVITDLRMPGMDGMELLRTLRAKAPGLPVVILTAHGTVDLAVEAMKAGAADFLLKPFDREAVLFTVDKCVRAGRSAESRPPPDPREADGSPEPLGASPAMAEVSRLVDRAAAARSTVLIRGETGSGKEVVARAIHARSERRDQPLVAVNCGGLPEALLESELFGHEKGAFTGATHAKPGRVELAEAGTLFLDEIGDLSLAVQVKLLRLLQEREYCRLGSIEPRRCDVRFIAATHQDLDAMVAEGTFREDLFYRLHVVPITVPPLRARRGDIAPLAQRFVRRHAHENRRGDVTLDAEALARLEALPWPGNVRELSNLVERLVVLTDAETIGAAEVEAELARHPPRRPSDPGPGPDGSTATLEERRQHAEREWIRQVLAQTGDNRTQAARILGISRRTLYNKLDELGLSAG